MSAQRVRFGCRFMRRRNVSRAAADLGLERSHLYKKMKALGVRRDS